MGKESLPAGCSQGWPMSMVLQHSDVLAALSALCQPFINLLYLYIKQHAPKPLLDVQHIIIASSMEQDFGAEPMLQNLLRPYGRHFPHQLASFFKEPHQNSKQCVVKKTPTSSPPHSPDFSCFLYFFKQVLHRALCFRCHV